MMKCICVDGPDEGLVMRCDELSTLPGWEVRSQVTPASPMIYVYRSLGEQDWRGRWKMTFVGKFTPGQFNRRERALEQV